MLSQGCSVVAHMRLEAIKLRSCWSQVRDQVYTKAHCCISFHIPFSIFRRVEGAISNNAISRTINHLYDEIDTYYDT